MTHDIRSAYRALARSPGFTTVAVLSLALGIGVNAAMFSVLYPVLLRPLPYEQPDRLVRIARAGADNVSIPEYEVVAREARSFEAVAAFRGGGELRLTTSDGPEWIRAAVGSPGLLETLRVRAALGRGFTADEARPGGPQAALVTDGLWRRAFDADPAVIGRAIRLDETTYTIVGVLPDTFWLPQPIDVLLPLRPAGGLADTGTNTLMLGRLAGSVSRDAAQAEVTALTAALRDALGPHAGRNYRGLAVDSYHDVLVAGVGGNLALLFGATSLLLLIACGNLTLLLLARYASRAREIAVRQAVGGSLRHVVRQFLIEHLLVVAMGLALGLAAAYALIEGLVAWMPFDMPASTPLRLDGTVVAFAAAVATLVVVALSAVPLVMGRRIQIVDALRAAGRSAGAEVVRQSTRHLLVVGEVALSTTLLVVAGLLMQSLYNLQREPLGFSPDGLTTFQTPLDSDTASPEARLSFVGQLQDRLAGIPGVAGVAATSVLPLTGQGNLPTERAGRSDLSIGGMEVRAVTPEYFDMMRISVREGRGLVPEDAERSLPVALVNETVAERWWPHGDAVGDRVAIGVYQGKRYVDEPIRTVVGVVADTKTTRLTEPPRPTVFVPLAQAGTLPQDRLAWIVRAAGVEGLADAIRRTVTSVAPAQRVTALQSMRDIVAATSAVSRFNTVLFGIFAGVALALAAVGLYGVLSYLVSERRQEIGTRMALGADRTDVVRRIMRQGAVLTVGGLAVGLVAALAAGRWLSSLLYGMTAHDMRAFAAVAVVLLAIGMAASAVPALRASRIDPMAAFRDE